MPDKNAVIGNKYRRLNSVCKDTLPYARWRKCPKKTVVLHNKNNDSPSKTEKDLALKCGYPL